nr:PhoU domain-containing protein [Liquorilactobacillus satsumensis]
MRKILEEQLSDLHEDFAQMGREVAQAIENATKVFQSHDKELANKVGENDNRINESEIYLERKTAQVIALQQPVASDLRVLITILKASSDLERIGDHAVSVAHAAMRIGDQRRNKEIEDTLVGLANMFIRCWWRLSKLMLIIMKKMHARLLNWTPKVMNIYVMLED